MGEGLSGGAMFAVSVARRAVCGSRGARPTLGANALVGFLLVGAGFSLLYLQVPATAPLPPENVDSPIAPFMHPTYASYAHKHEHLLYVVRHLSVKYLLWPFPLASLC